MAKINRKPAACRAEVNEGGRNTLYRTKPGNSGRVASDPWQVAVVAGCILPSRSGSDGSSQCPFQRRQAPVSEVRLPVVINFLAESNRQARVTPVDRNVLLSAANNNMMNL
jgi:hypothetical protein